MNFSIVLMLLGLGIWFFALPFGYYFKYRLQARPTFEAYRPDGGMPEAVRENFERRFAEFSNLKFQHLGTFTMPHLADNVRSIFALYEHPVLKVTASTTALFVKVNEVWQLKGQYVAMATGFVDDTDISTTNQSDLIVLPVREGNIRTQHPELQVVADVFRAHRMLVEQNRNGREPVLERNTKYGGDVLSYFSESCFEYFSAAADVGWLRFKKNEMEETSHSEPEADANPLRPVGDNPFEAPAVDATDRGSVFVATLRGAFAMGWMGTWPAKGIVARIRFARDRKLLAKTGFQWE